MNKEPQFNPEGHGESHGEWLERIILEEAIKRGKEGLPVDEVLLILKAAMNKHEIATGGNPENVVGALDNDSVSFTLIDLEKEGKIRVEGGKVYQIET
jgi:hypothetical protein